MRCLYCHSPFLLPNLSQLNHKHPPKANNLVWITRKEPPPPLLRLRHRTKAVTGNSLLLGLTSSAAKTPDVSVLLLTGAVFLFMYWIANFVVPDMVVKDLQSKITSDDDQNADLQSEKPEQENTSKDDADNNSMEDKKQSTATSKVKGFNRTKR